MGTHEKCSTKSYQARETNDTLSLRTYYVCVSQYTTHNHICQRPEDVTQALMRLLFSFVLCLDRIHLSWTTEWRCLGLNTIQKATTRTPQCVPTLYVISPLRLCLHFCFVYSFFLFSFLFQFSCILPILLPRFILYYLLFIAAHAFVVCLNRPAHLLPCLKHIQHPINCRDDVHFQCFWLFFIVNRFIPFEWMPVCASDIYIYISIHTISLWPPMKTFKWIETYLCLYIANNASLLIDDVQMHWQK